MNDVKELVDRAAALLDRLEALLPAPPPGPDWAANAFRWRSHGNRGRLQAIHHPQEVELDDLLGLDRQKEKIVRNTRQFLAGRSANNLLLWGPRGTGKSSLIKAIFNALRGQGLRLVERVALQWALRRGSRSGRTAWRFARDWAGRQTIER